MNVPRKIVFERPGTVFLYGSLNPHVSEVTGEAFLSTVTRLESTFSQGLEQDRFIDAYVYMLMYYINEPIEEWIPKFFDNVGCASRHSFASTIGYRIRRMDESTLDNVWNSWLKAYWQNRLRGVPVPLDAGEIGEMLEWLPDMEGCFPDAVELAVNMPTESVVLRSIILRILENMPTESVVLRSIILRILEGQLWSQFPESTAKLLVYLEMCSSPTGWTNGKVLIEKLTALDLSDDIKQELEELNTKFGYM